MEQAETNILFQLIQQQRIDLIQNWILKDPQIINIQGSLGKNAFHYSIELGLIEIVKTFIEAEADLNNLTQDGWSPLQIAINMDHYLIAEMLAKSDKIDLNLITPNRSALHLACFKNNYVSIEILIKQGANTQMKNSDIIEPLSLITNIEVIEKVQLLLTQTLDIKKNLKQKIFPIVTGYLFKKSNILGRQNTRYFVLNINQGIFIRYKKFQDFPNKPNEIIQIVNIKGLQKLDPSWYDYQKMFYFELQHNNQKQIYYGQYESTVFKWVYYLSLAIHQSQINPISVDIKDYEDIVNQTSKCVKEQFEQILDCPGKQHFKNCDSNIITSIEQQIWKKSINNILFDECQSLNIQEITENDQNLFDERLCFQSFDIIRKLGQGAFGHVYLARKLDDQKLYAIKALHKRQIILKRKLRYAITEANILKTIDHPFILQMHFAFQTPQNLYLVIDYCCGSDLLSILTKNKRLNEKQAIFYISELVLAIQHLHNNKILYRDLKPENILISQDGHIKLADFGLSKENINQQETTNTFCGSPAYITPEMLARKGTNMASDNYGIGAILYELLVGYPAFYNDDLKIMYKNIEQGQLGFPSWVSPRAKSFIQQIMAMDPNSRLGASDQNEILNHPLFEGIDFQKVLKKEYQPPWEFSEQYQKDLFSKAQKDILQDNDYNSSNKTINRIKNFSFMKDEEEDKTQ